MRLSGKILRTHGLKGNLLVRLDGRGLSNPESLKHLFVKQNAEYLPYRIQDIKNTYGDQFHIQLKGILTQSEASKLNGSDVYLPEDFFVDEGFSASDLIGYSLYNAQGELVGELMALIENGPQMWFETANSEKSFLIPFDEELILEIDELEKTISLDLPEGLDEL